jgi:hypothetical protein
MDGLPPLFKEGSLQALRPSTSNTAHSAGYLEVFPRAGSRKPQLLLQLESLLSEKLRMSEKASGEPQPAWALQRGEHQP